MVEIESNGFRTLNTCEAMLTLKVLRRNKKLNNGNVDEFQELSVGYIGDDSFTTCLLKASGVLFVGSSKRMSKDKVNDQLGRDISFTRAIRNFFSKSAYINEGGE